MDVPKYVVESSGGTLHGFFESAASAQRWAARELPTSAWAIRPVTNYLGGKLSERGQ